MNVASAHRSSTITDRIGAFRLAEELGVSPNKINDAKAVLKAELPKRACTRVRCCWAAPASLTAFLKAVLVRDMRTGQVLHNLGGSCEGWLAGAYWQDLEDGRLVSPPTEARSLSS